MTRFAAQRRQWCAQLGMLLLACGTAMAAPPAPLQVVYPRIAERAADDYGYLVLRLALDKSGIPYHLAQSAHPMNQQRARLMLENGGISIFETGTSASFEARFDAIYFPVERGLSGFRLLLINKNRSAEFAQLRTLTDLSKLTAGQGPGWADNAILEAAGIKVHITEFSSLPLMLNASHIDFFPLGIEEVETVLARNKQRAPDLMIEPHLALHYDFARLFFVRKGNRVLHDAVLTGLTRAYADGSLEQLLESNSGLWPRHAQAAIKRRAVIELHNPYMTEAYRHIPRKYFYTPE